MNNITGLLAFRACALLSLFGWAASEGKTEGIPEPSLVMYGIIQPSGGPRLTAGTLTWTFKSSNEDASITVSVLLANINDQFSYVLRVPCETVLSGMQASSNTLQLAALPISYDRAEVLVNGEAATFVDPQLASFTLSSTDRGPLHRVDLQVATAGPDYAAWATLHFGQPNIDPNDDPDGDGASNYEEFMTGTDPTDPQSVFAFIEVLPEPSGGVHIRWSSISGRSYTVQRSTELTAGFVTIKSAVAATPPVNSYHDATATVPGPYFYRLRVE